MKPKKKTGRSHSTGRPSSNYSSLTLEEQSVYHHDAIKEHRSRNTSSFRANGTATTRSTKVAKRSASTPARTRGRPSVTGTAMSPQTQSRKYRENKRSLEKQAAVKEARSRSSDIRWKGPDPGPGSSDVADTEVGIQPLDDSVSDEAGMTVRNFRRYKAKVLCSLPTSAVDIADLFVYSLNKFLFDDLTPCPSYKLCGSLTEHQLRYKYRLISDIYLRFAHDSEAKKQLTSIWLESIVNNTISYSIIQHNNIFIPEHYLPKRIAVEAISQNLAATFLKRSNTSEEQRKQGIRYVVEVARQAQLSIDNYGDISALQAGTQTSFVFAKGVLQAIAENTEEELLKRDVRADSIKCTEWPSMISEFVFQPENTRAVPGQEDVSIRYGVRRPKYILLHSKEEIAAKFKENNPDCPYKVPTIIREFPQNAVPSSTRDLERNTCPYHANARRLERCLSTALKGTDVVLQSSCRKMATSVMCDCDHRDDDDPLTWSEKCAMGHCKTCPTLTINIPANKKEELVTYSQWTNGLKEVKPKKGSKDDSTTVEDPSIINECVKEQTSAEQALAEAKKSGRKRKKRFRCSH